MKKKKVIERYRHLRTLIERAKDDAERWSEGKQLLLLQDIKEKSASDFFIYDKAYVKFVNKKKQTMHDKQVTAATHKEAADRSKAGHSTLEEQLGRIADALERIAHVLEEASNEQDPQEMN